MKQEFMQIFQGLPSPTDMVQLPEQQLESYVNALLDYLTARLDHETVNRQEGVPIYYGLPPLFTSTCTFMELDALNVLLASDPHVSIAFAARVNGNFPGWTLIGSGKFTASYLPGQRVVRAL
jgi:hypothetical protein